MLTKRMERKLDGNCTRMLRTVLNESWRQHPTKQQLYGRLPPISKTIQIRRARNAGCCWRSKGELISDVFQGTRSYGRAKVGQMARTYLHLLCTNTRCSMEDLPRAMDDGDEWQERFRDIHANGTPWWWWWCLNGICTNWNPSKKMRRLKYSGILKYKRIAYSRSKVQA